MEIEAKFVVLAQSTEDHLLTADTLGTYELKPFESHDLHDTYLDTSDYRLLAAGYAYRRRIDGDRTYLTLKGLGNVQDGALHQREEMEVLAPNHEAGPTGPLAERLHALGIEGPLSPLFELQQQRFERSVWDHKRRIGLLSIDRVRFAGRQRTIPFTELEFELGEGGEETDLRRVIEALRARKGLSPEPTSKFSRGLVLAVGCKALRAAGVYALKQEDTVADTARKLFHPLICKLLLHEFDAYRGEDIEGVHDMRVTARRLRTATRIFTPYLEPNAARRLAKGFKRMTKAMGPVRELDVFRAHMEPKLPQQHEKDDALSRILAFAWDGAYIPARNHLTHYLESEQHGAFKATLETTLTSALHSAGAQQPLANVLPEILMTRLEAFQRWSHTAEDPTATMDALHSLRIETKRLRYTVEFLRPLLDPEIDKTLDHLIRIQDHLGHLQDTAFACEHWAAVRAWGTWDLPDQPATLWHRSEPEPVPAAASYWNDECEARDRLRAGVSAMWADTAPAVIRVVTTVAETWRDKVGQIRYNHTDEEHEVIVEGEMETSMNNSEPTYVILLGPPASGKGTQASRLEDELAIPHVSSGDLFRYNLKNETALGLKAKTYMDKGALVPDDVTIAMVLDRLSRDDCEKGALLDGFPRTIPQAEALDEALAGEGEAIDLVLNIQVPEDVLIKRVTGRRLCRQCGASYHLEYSPPEEPGVCDECGGELYQRDDDTEETARKRLDVYREQTQPLVDYYGDKGIVVDIDGDKSIDAVTESLLEAIEENV